MRDGGFSPVLVLSGAKSLAYAQMNRSDGRVTTPAALRERRSENQVSDTPDLRADRVPREIRERLDQVPRDYMLELIYLLERRITGR